MQCVHIYDVITAGRKAQMLTPHSIERPLHSLAEEYSPRENVTVTCNCNWPRTIFYGTTNLPLRECNLLGSGKINQTNTSGTKSSLPHRKKNLCPCFRGDIGVDDTGDIKRKEKCNWKNAAASYADKWSRFYTVTALVMWQYWLVT